jgi:hypothetical protein
VVAISLERQLTPLLPAGHRPKFGLDLEHPLILLHPEVHRLRFGLTQDNLLIRSLPVEALVRDQGFRPRLFTFPSRRRQIRV